MFVPITCILSLVVALVVPFSRRNMPSRILRLWANSVFWMSGIKLEITGLEHVDASRPSIYMANHASMIDIPILVAALPVHIRFLFKHSLMYVPFLGQAMLLMGMIPVDRGDRTKAVGSLRKTGQKIKSGIHVVIFPEGTRTKTGHLLPFKKGGFLLAIQEQIDIVPVTIENSREVCGRNNLWTHKGIVRVRVHPPVEAKSFTVGDRKGFQSKVEVAIRDGLPTHRQVPPKTADSHPA